MTTITAQNINAKANSNVELNLIKSILHKLIKNHISCDTFYID